MFGFRKKETEAEIEIPAVWPANNILVVKIAGKSVAVSRLDGQYYAYSNVCPHAGATLSDDNTLVNDCIICPLHQYKFNIRNGLNVSGEEYRLKTYKVSMIDPGRLKILV